MLSFLGRRLLQIIPTLILVSMLIFGLQQLLPGDPALIMAGEERDPAVLEEIRQQYRLNEPIPIQYFYWIKGVLSGNLGESMRLKASVASLVAEKLPVTLQLAAMAIVVALGIGIPAGIILTEHPIVYIYHRTVLIAHTAKLEGYKQMPDGLVRVTGLTLK